LMELFVNYYFYYTEHHQGIDVPVKFELITLV
jgi:hypothetical protein